MATYCASKWGIEGLTAALAQELPAGLAAVALNPGIIDTRMLRSCFGADAGSYPTPNEWAKAAVPYLASLGTRHNGKALTVPGMWHQATVHLCPLSPVRGVLLLAAVHGPFQYM